MNKKKARKIKSRIAVIRSQISSVEELLAEAKDPAYLTSFKSEYLKLAKHYEEDLLSLKDYEKRISALSAKYRAKVK